MPIERDANHEADKPAARDADEACCYGDSHGHRIGAALITHRHPHSAGHGYVGASHQHINRDAGYHDDADAIPDDDSGSVDYTHIVTARDLDLATEPEPDACGQPDCLHTAVHSADAPSDCVLTTDDNRSAARRERDANFYGGAAGYADPNQPGRAVRYFNGRPIDRDAEPDLDDCTVYASADRDGTVHVFVGQQSIDYAVAVASGRLQFAPIVSLGDPDIYVWCAPDTAYGGSGIAISLLRCLAERASFTVVCSPCDNARHHYGASRDGCSCTCWSRGRVTPDFASLLARFDEPDPGRGDAGR